MPNVETMLTLWKADVVQSLEWKEGVMQADLTNINPNALSNV